MRLGVLDVGSNTIHLQVIDAHHGAPPIANSSYKSLIRLTEFLDDEGAISQLGIQKITETISKSLEESAHLQIDELLAFATSAIREAINSDEVLDHVNKTCGIDLQVLSGENEASFTFLAARRWHGWSAGDLLVLDIGGGSLEIARGNEEEPSFATSLQLGAGRVTRNFLDGDPYSKKSIKILQEHIDSQLGDLALDLSDFAKKRATGTSKTFRTLAKITQNYFPKLGPNLTRAGLADVTQLLQDMKLKERKAVPGISDERSEQIVGGAMVANSLMRILNLEEIQICPWALREGIVLRRLDWIER